MEGLSAARRLIEGFAPRHAGIGQGARLCELTSTDLLQCADSAHWMVTGAGGRCAADPAGTPARSWADRPSVPIGWRRWRLRAGGQSLKATSARALIRKRWPSRSLVQCSERSCYLRPCPAETASSDCVGCGTAAAGHRAGRVVALFSRVPLPARRCGTSSRLCVWSDVADRGYGARVRVNQKGRVPIEEYEAQRSRHHHHRIALARTSVFHRPCLHRHRNGLGCRF